MDWLMSVTKTALASPLAYLARRKEVQYATVFMPLGMGWKPASCRLRKSLPMTVQIPAVSSPVHIKALGVFTVKPLGLIDTAHSQDQTYAQGTGSSLSCLSTSLVHASSTLPRPGECTYQEQHSPARAACCSIAPKICIGWKL